MSELHSDEFRRCLEEVDVDGLRRLWATTHAHLYQPADDHEALVMIHYSRTKMVSIAPRLREYSHRWLVGSGLPSALPDEMRPKAEQVGPRIVSGVGIAVSVGTDDPNDVYLANVVRQAMSDAVMTAYADGNTDPAFVSARMEEARRRTLKKLVG